MQSDRRFVVVVSVSLAWALIVSGVFYRVAGGSGGRARAAAQKQVVVATRPLSVGVTLDRDAVSLRGVPEDMFPAGAFSRVEDVLERPVISAMQAGEPVVESRVAIKGSGVGLGPLIPPGMRAVSVRVNDVVGVAGFVLPGMRVDVLVTGRPPAGGDTETQTALQNITVLSAGQTIQTDGRSQPIVAPVVTLLVKPAEAEALTLASAEGHIQLVLRNSTDQASVPTPGRRLHELYGAAAPTSAAEPSAPAVRRPPAARPTNQAPAYSRSAPEAERPHAVPVPEPEQMIMIRGSVQKVEVFSKGQETK